MCLRMQRAEGETGLMFSINRIRCDATNTRFKSKKLHVLELRATFSDAPIYPSTKLADNVVVSDYTETRQTLGTLQTIPESCTSARGILGVIDKQVDSIVGDMGSATRSFTSALSSLCDSSGVPGNRAQAIEWPKPAPLAPSLLAIQNGDGDGECYEDRCSVQLEWYPNQLSVPDFQVRSSRICNCIPLTRFT